MTEESSFPATTTTCVRANRKDEGSYWMPQGFEVFQTHSGDIMVRILSPGLVPLPTIHINLCLLDAHQLRDRLSKVLREAETPEEDEYDPFKDE